MEQMIKVQIEGKEYEYPAGTTYQTIAGDFQKEYEDDILLVLFDHRLRELGKSLKSEGTIEFITAKQDPGKKAYRRSTTLLLQKAVDNLYGKDGVSIQIRHSLGQGYYCTLKGAKEDISDLILSIKIEMMLISVSGKRVVGPTMRSACLQNGVCMIRSACSVIAEVRESMSMI